MLSQSTLGRIAASNLRKPKKLFDLSVGADDGDENEVAEDSSLKPARKFMFASRSLTYLIEEGIRSVMDVEDCDRYTTVKPL
jgi:hypothetical protein